MTEIVLIFFITAGISFAGSVQLGPVNAMVVQTTLQKSVRSGLWLAFGGCLPEIIYATLALGGNTLLSQNNALVNILEIAVVPFFLLIGVGTIWQQYRKKPSERKDGIIGKNPFVTGFTLGLLNPQLLPFWLAVLVYLNGIHPVNSLMRQYAFVFGTAAGAFAILSVFVWTTARYREKLTGFFDRFPIGYIVGGIFIGLAVLQGIKSF